MRLPSSFLTLLLLAIAVKGSRPWRDEIKHVVFFGDSLTDQSRSHSIDNGTYPGKYYETVWPPNDPAANGRVSWPR